MSSGNSNPVNMSSSVNGDYYTFGSTVSVKLYLGWVNNKYVLHFIVNGKEVFRTDNPKCNRSDHGWSDSKYYRDGRWNQGTRIIVSADQYDKCYEPWQLNAGTYSVSAIKLFYSGISGDAWYNATNSDVAWGHNHSGLVDGQGKKFYGAEWTMPFPTSFPSGKFPSNNDSAIANHLGKKAYMSPISGIADYFTATLPNK